MKVFLFLLLNLANTSYANICDTIFRSTNVGCTDLANSHTSGGSYPLLFDAFNFNPSALPTFPTPVGVEGYYDSGKINASLIKGTQNAGFGAAVKNTDTTFFSGVENYKVALKNNNQNNYAPSALDQTFTLGSALNLLKLPSVFNLPFGLGYRINPEKKLYSFQPGLEIRTSLLTVGASQYTEKPKAYNDGYYDIQEDRKNYSFSGSLRLWILLLDYSYLSQVNRTVYYQAGSVVNGITDNYTIKTKILSGTLVYGPVTATAAYRTQDDSRISGNYSTNASTLDYKESHFLAGAAFKTEHLELGAFYNYVLNNDTSLLVKIFF